MITKLNPINRFSLTLLFQNWHFLWNLCTYNVSDFSTWRSLLECLFLCIWMQKHTLSRRCHALKLSSNIEKLKLFPVLCFFSVLQEVLSAVITVELLSSCPLPETCSKALWLFAPQIISAMVVGKKTNT